MPEYLIATDTPEIFEQFRSVLDAPGSSIRWVQEGPRVTEALNHQPADLAVIDMQIGNMGGIAVALDIRMEAEAGRIERVPALIVLDRRPDVFLARRAGVEGWILKPLDPIRIRRATSALVTGRTWYDDSYQPDPGNAALPSGSIAYSGK